MVKNDYTIDEILNAVNELQSLPKKKQNVSNENKLDEDIPKNTLRLIQEAENAQNK